LKRNDVITAARTLLSDPAAAIWSAALLSNLLDHTVDYMSLYYPADDTADIATVSGSREISLAALNLNWPIRRILAVEFPIGNTPRTFNDFTIFSDVLTMTAATGNAANARVYYQRYRELHSIWVALTAYALGDIVVPTGTPNGYCYICTTAGTSHATTQPTWPTTIGTTVADSTVVWTCRKYPYISEEHYPLLCLGLSGYAYEEYGRRLINSLATGGTQTAARYVKQGYYALEQFRKELRTIARLNEVRVSSLYLPQSSRVSRFLDPGP
jgi:hypothetical protein